MTEPGLLLIGYTLFALAGLTGFEPGANERVEVAIHHTLNVTGLVAGTQVLHHLVRLKDVAANLIAEGDVAFLAVVFLQRRPLLVLLLLEEPGFQHLDRQFPVLVLTALALALHDDAGRRV